MIETIFLRDTSVISPLTSCSLKRRLSQRQAKIYYPALGTLLITDMLLLTKGDAHEESRASDTQRLRRRYRVGVPVQFRV